MNTFKIYVRAWMACYSRTSLPLSQLRCLWRFHRETLKSHGLY